MRKTLFVFGCIATLLLGACTPESNRPIASGEGFVRAINAIPTSPQYAFLIEERPIGIAAYASATQQVLWDDLLYTFNFETQLPDELLISRVASSTLKVEKDFEYTFVITGDAEAPTIIVWEEPTQFWSGTETTMQARFGHTAASLGAIDVYFAPPDIPPAAGAAVGTLSFGEILSGTEYPASEHVYTITSAGNPGDILFTSVSVNPGVRTGFLISIFDGTANNLGPLTAQYMPDGGTSTTLPEANLLPTVRFIHASASLQASDIYTDELLMDQIVSDHAFRDVTADIELEGGAYTFTYTPTGNTGAILLEFESAAIPAAHSQVYAFGEAGALDDFSRIPDRRSIETLVRFTLLDMAMNHPLVDFYVVEAGTDIADAFPLFFRIAPGGASFSTNLDVGDLEMYVTVATEKTVITGPVAITTALGEVLEYIIYDNVDPATADLVLIPLP